MILVYLRGLKVSLSSKREWDRNRSFVRIRFRRPTSAQLSRASLELEKRTTT